MFDRNALRAAAAPKTKVISVPEWGGIEFTIRQISGADVANQEGFEEGASLAHTAAASIIDPETGERVFSSSAADIAELQSYTVSGLLRINDEVKAFNKIQSPEATAKN